MQSESARYAKLSRRLTETPAVGKTYSLFGDDDGTDGYYRAIATLADHALELLPDLRSLIDAIREAATSKRRLRRARSGNPGGRAVPAILAEAGHVLTQYTQSVETHLTSLPFTRRFDRSIAMNEDQYHLAMLEIELMNRAGRAAFLSAQTRLAFLPHCLHDLNADCKADSDGIDHVCRGCSGDCWINAVTALLRSHDVRPYIWMRANLPRLFRGILKRGESLGVLGIACIPELVHGMRLCERHSIPALGLPLNGNRCARWTGAFHPNSVNLGRLETLVGRNEGIAARGES